MEIWINQDKTKFRLPVLPSSFTIEKTMDNKTVNIVSLGEVTRIGKRNLATITLDSFFPRNEETYAQYSGYPKPEKCVSIITSMMDAPVRLIIVGAGINMLATIESFSHGDMDQVGNVAFTIALKWQRTPKLKKVKMTTKTKTTKKIKKTTTKRTTKKVKSKTVTVKKGDTLTKIAKRETGSADNYRAIANQNGIKNIRNLKPGTRIAMRV